MRECARCHSGHLEDVESVSVERSQDQALIFYSTAFGDLRADFPQIPVDVFKFTRFSRKGKIQDDPEKASCGSTRLPCASLRNFQAKQDASDQQSREDKNKDDDR
jgi:hypothetical protein